MGCIGTPPDSDYARHVLQVNMKLHALSGVPVPPGVAPYKSLNNRSLLLYSQPQFPTCVAVPVPLMTALQLATVLDGPMSIVSRLRAAVGTGTDKRVLLNIAWSFSLHFPTTLSTSPHYSPLPHSAFFRLHLFYTSLMFWMRTYLGGRSVTAKTF